MMGPAGTATEGSGAGQDPTGSLKTGGGAKRSTAAATEELQVMVERRKRLQDSLTLLENKIYACEGTCVAHLCPLPAALLSMSSLPRPFFFSNSPHLLASGFLHTPWPLQTVAHVSP